MKEEFIISTHPNYDSSAAEIIQKNLKKFNESILGQYEPKPFCLYTTDENKVIGGINGDVFGTICSIFQVWVHDDYRKLKLGTKLFKELEEFARNNKCESIQLDTHEFQARGFYEKIGFNVIAVLPNNFMGHTTYILRKELKGIN